MAEIVLPQSLQERIAQAAYQPATESDLPGGVTAEDDGSSQRVDLDDGSQPDAGQGAQRVDSPDTQVYPTTPAGPPQYDPAAVQQIVRRSQEMERQLQQLQTQQRIAQLQAEEQQYADSIAHLPPAQQEQLLHQRERGQAQTINLYLQQQLMQLTDKLNGQDQQTHEQRETVAKRVLAYSKASAAGLDFSNPVVFSQLTGDHITKPDQMDEAVKGLLQLAGSPQGQRPIIAGGARATNAGPPAPKRGSGDLGSLINSRSYELVPAE